MASKNNDIERLARALDSRFRLPFGLKIGWDGILGLIPGIGDTITSALSLYIVYRAAVLGCSPWVIARMGLNVLVDVLLGAIPLFGDAMDFLWKANDMNVRLLDRSLADARGADRGSKAVVLAVFALVLAAVAAAVWAVVAIVRALWAWIAATGALF